MNSGPETIAEVYLRKDDHHRTMQTRKLCLRVKVGLHMIIKELVDMVGKDRKKKERVRNTKKLAAGIGIAAAAGVAAGILLAPQSGKETRDDIKNKAEDIADSTKETVHKKVETVKKSASHVAQEISDVIKDAHVKKDAVKKDVKKKVEKIHDAVVADIDKTSE